MMRVGRIIAMSAYTLEVTLRVHHLAVLICGFVSIQIDWLAAYRTGVFFAGGTIRLAHGGFPPF
jgi:hypothetical protein